MFPRPPHSMINFNRATDQPLSLVLTDRGKKESYIPINCLGLLCTSSDDIKLSMAGILLTSMQIQPA